MAGISGIDIALWDLKGKAYDAPVRELLGGSSDSIPCYATGMYFRKDISDCLLYTSPSPRDVEEARMPSSA